jgi:hypothetical protein
MNTIAIGSVVYNELEVKHYIDNSNQKTEKLNDAKYKIQEFFNECEWEDSQTTITRSKLNELFSAIGLEHLRGKYKATVTITAYIDDYAATDEDDAKDCIEDDIEVSIGSSANVTVDRIEVDDVEEDD